MNPSDIIDRLRAQGWIDDRILVDQGIAVVDLSRSHSVFAIEIGRRSRWVVKQHKRPRGDFDGTTAREWQAYALAREFEPLAQLMPAFVGMLDDDVLMVEAIEGQPIWSEDTAVSAKDCARILKDLARLHRASAAGLDAQDVTLPWILRVMDFDSPEPLWNGVGGEYLRSIGQVPGAIAALRRTRAAWKSKAFIHGDAKLDNAIRTSDDRYILVDWELSGRGDPLWDIAGVMLQQSLKASSLPYAERLQYFREERAAALEAYGHLGTSQNLLPMLGVWMLQSTYTSLTSGAMRLPETTSIVQTASLLLGAGSDESGVHQPESWHGLTSFP